MQPTQELRRVWIPCSTHWVGTYTPSVSNPPFWASPGHRPLCAPRGVNANANLNGWRVAPVTTTNIHSPALETIFFFQISWIIFLSWRRAKDVWTEFKEKSLWLLVWLSSTYWHDLSWQLVCRGKPTVAVTSFSTTTMPKGYFPTKRGFLVYQNKEIQNTKEFLQCNINHFLHIMSYFTCSSEEAIAQEWPGPLSSQNLLN